MADSLVVLAGAGSLGHGGASAVRASAEKNEMSPELIRPQPIDWVTGALMLAPFGGVPPMGGRGNG